MPRTSIRLRIYIIVFAGFSLFSSAWAQEKAAEAEAEILPDIVPASSLSSDLAAEDPDATHPAVQLTPDKSEIVRLDQKAGTVIVGNPNHISVLAENAQTLVIVPHQAGATFLTALDEKGNVIMSRHVIVASPKKQYVRIRKSCASGANNCQATQVYYCPDMCHEIAPVIANENAEAPDLTTISGAAQNTLPETTEAAETIPEPLDTE